MRTFAEAIGSVLSAEVKAFEESQIESNQVSKVHSAYAPSDVNSRSLPFEKRRGKVRSALWFLLNEIAAVIAALNQISLHFSSTFPPN